MKNVYVISIKQIKSYNGKDLPVEEQQFCYAQLDDKGPLASGYPCFSVFYGAKTFITEKDAEEWWEHNKKYLIHAIETRYDINTLAIRKIVFNKRKNLKL